jgi:ADP-heptose:LPS heptosyltransferase
MTATASPAIARPRSVLIIKPSSLGDVVTATPVLRGLRRTFPDSHIAWLLNDEYAPLLQHDTDLNELILFGRGEFRRLRRWPAAAGELIGLLRRLRARQFDWAIDLQGLLRSGLLAAASGAEFRAGFAKPRERLTGWFYTDRIAVAGQHAIDRNVELARSLGLDARREDMTLQVSPGARDFAERFLSGHGLKRRGFIICVPPARWKSKLYPVRHWRKVVAGFVRDSAVVLLGAGGWEKLLCDQVAEGIGPGVLNMAGRTGIAEMVALIAASAAVVCNDSAAAFVAQAVSVGVVVLFGPTRPERTGPAPGGVAIVAQVPCRGCLKRRCRHITCMESIDPSEVISAGRKVVEATS